MGLQSKDIAHGRTSEIAPEIGEDRVSLGFVPHRGRRGLSRQYMREQVLDEWDRIRNFPILGHENRDGIDPQRLCQKVAFEARNNAIPAPSRDSDNRPQAEQSC